ncbi:hypothetical protein QJS10_CPB19g00241 [Acorus calamus]|uniref:PGG domain-containing protein n=1 Tax=Acorus calamus TaxID=4465 RepID=A0AAV9CGF1_ACOCL|nr:hypothetical protein QJS10_CPB19g00241 [Acorus calamus]
MEGPCARLETASPPLRGWRGWLNNDKNTMLVVLTLFAAVLYQAEVSPPGGFWQDDDDGEHGHVAGRPIMRDKNFRIYMYYRIYSSLGFFSSMLQIILLLGGYTQKSLLFRICFQFSLDGLAISFLCYVPTVTFWVLLGVNLVVLIVEGVVLYRNWENQASQEQEQQQQEECDVELQQT